MKNPVLSYKEFTDQKRLTENKNNIGTPLNESFLDAVLRFFRGIFDLFGNKKLKKNYEDMRVYYKRIQYDKDIDNEELADELDSKKIRRSFNDASKMIGNGIEIDKEKGIRVTADLQKYLASWIAQLIGLNESVYVGILQKMLNNKETVKKFTWVPAKYRENSKEWYKQKECVLDKKIKEALLKILDAPQDKQENLIKTFVKHYIEHIAISMDKESGYDPGDGAKLLKANDKDFLDQVFNGFSLMCESIRVTMNSMVKNTNDEKIAEIAGKKIESDRIEQDKKDKKKPESKDPNKTNTEEDSTSNHSARAKRSNNKKPKVTKPSDSINTGTPSSNSNKSAEKSTPAADNAQTEN